VERAITASLMPFERGSQGENPYKVQQDLQDTMQNLVGIVRTEAEMQDALVKIEALKERADRVGVEGHREYHSGWHTSLDLRNLMAVSEAITRSAIERKESRGGHFREDYPDKDPAAATFNIICRKGPGGEMQLRRETIPAMRDDLKKIVEENK